MSALNQPLDAPSLAFWRTDFALNRLPFLASLVTHLTLIALDLATAGAIGFVVRTATVRRPAMADLSIIMPAVEPCAAVNLEIGGAKELATDFGPADVEPDMSAWNKAAKWSPELLDPGSRGSSRDWPLLGTGGYNSSAGSGGLGGPRVTFMGITCQARRVIFMFDQPGILMQTFDPLRIELLKTIDKLTMPQGFNILFCRCSTVEPMADSLVLASMPSKTKASNFLNRTSPHGESAFVPGLVAAFAMKPDVIYILTNGNFPDSQAVINECRKLNVSHTVKINTIAFLDRGEVYEKVLKQIATENGGQFRYESEKDLGF